MKIVSVSDGIIFIPKSKIGVFVLWQLSFFVGNFEKTFNPEVYPLGRRLKLLSNNY